MEHETLKASRGLGRAQGLPILQYLGDLAGALSSRIRPQASRSEGATRRERSTIVGQAFYDVVLGS